MLSLWIVLHVSRISLITTQFKGLNVLHFRTLLEMPPAVSRLRCDTPTQTIQSFSHYAHSLLSLKNVQRSWRRSAA
jgi:hypothetical protein